MIEAMSTVGSALAALACLWLMQATTADCGFQSRLALLKTGHRLLLGGLAIALMLNAGCTLATDARGNAKSDISDFGNDEQLKEYLQRFIKPKCCFTNNCCWAIDASAVTDLGNNQFRINATGQVIAAEGNSPDGRYWRCACDPVPGGWWRHEHANTRCLYVPIIGF